jgi:hypothetical protein
MRVIPSLTPLLRSSGVANSRRRWVILVVVGLLAAMTARLPR